MYKRIIPAVSLLILWTGVIFIGQVSAASPAARIRLEEKLMKTYRLGPDDPNPPLFDDRVYPYPMQTDITRNSVDSLQKVITLENDYIKVLMLPEIGGRLLGAMDKTNDNYEFLYYNKVIKPALIANRGAWLSGGIEWNFPSFGHTVTTIAPMHYKIIENPDGSVTCVVGETEYVRRMRWSVSLTVYPDKSYIKIVNTLYNCTPLHHNAYYWQNAAVHATMDAQVIFPPTNYTMPFGGSRMFPWPILDGVDVSLYKNTAEAFDYFCGMPGEYNGIYYHEKDEGTVHYANKFDVPGRKFFTWGTSDNGNIWIDILTDEDGQYLEIQNGRLPTQGDVWKFGPFAVERFVDYWYPVKKMEGFVKANQFAAVNCEQRDGGIFVAVNVTEHRRNLRLVLKGDGRELYSTSIPDIAPEGHFSQLVSTSARPSVPELILYDSDGNELIHYTREEITTPIPEAKASPGEKPGMTAQDLYLLGYNFEKRWQPERAAEYYRRAIEKEPNHTEALYRVGLYYYKTAQFQMALESLTTAVDLNEDFSDARYYRGLTCLMLGDEVQAEKDLQMVRRRMPYRGPAYYLLSQMSMKKGDYHEALEMINESLRYSPDNYKAMAVKAFILRKLKKYSEAEVVLRDLLNEDPLNVPAHCESFFLHRAQGSETIAESARNEFMKMCYRGYEDFVETAIDYAACGLLDNAGEILDMGIERSSGNVSPMLYYYAGYFSGKAGKGQESRDYFGRAMKASPDYAFPNRIECVAVLKSAIRANPDDWKARYLLATYLASKDQWKDALRIYYEAEQLGASFSVLYRNVASIYQERARNPEKAAEYYRKAISANPGDYNYYLDLDQIYRQLRLIEKRVELFESAPAAVMENFNSQLGLANLKMELGDYDAALRILEEGTFHPWELWTGARRSYHVGHFCRGMERMMAGTYYNAIEDFMAVEIFPRNLGTGRRHDDVFPRENYFAGICYNRLGQNAKAREIFKTVSEYAVAEFSEDNCFRAYALKELGSNDYKAILRDILSHAEDRQGGRRGGQQSAYLEGLAYFGLDYRDKAIESLRKCLDADPYNQPAKIMLRYITQQ